MKAKHFKMGEYWIWPGDRIQVTVFTRYKKLELLWGCDIAESWKKTGNEKFTWSYLDAKILWLK